MIKIYGSRFSSGFRCYWLLEELGISYEVVPVDFSKGENKSADFLKLNPNGKIPVIVDEDFVLWESLAINYYLIEKYGFTKLLMGDTVQDHAEVNKWNAWACTNLSPAFHPLVMQKYRNTPDSEAIKAAREQELPRLILVLENQLAGKDYLALNKFTLADITVMSDIRKAAFVEFDLSNYPNILAWRARVTEREAYKKIAV